jgi:hypothetical protein
MRPVPDLLHQLARDHRRLDERLRALLTDRQRRTAAAVGGLAVDLLVHEAAEQVLLHPLVAARLPDGRRIARERTDEERTVARLLRAVLAHEADDLALEPATAALHSAFVGHADREELEVFPALRHVTSRSELRELGRAHATLAVHLPTRLRCAAGAPDADARACELGRARDLGAAILEEFEVELPTGPARASTPSPARKVGGRRPGRELAGGRA